MTVSDSTQVPESILILGAGVFGLSTLRSLLTSEHYASTRIILLDRFLPTLSESDETKTNGNGNGVSSHTDSNTVNGTTTNIQATVQHNPNAASIDSSRIIRADYKNPVYTRMAVRAQEQYWRTRPNEEYSESGLVLVTSSSVPTSAKAATCDGDNDGKQDDVGGRKYVQTAEKNCAGMKQRVQGIDGGREGIRKATLGFDLHSGSPDLNGSAQSNWIGDVGYENLDSGWANAELAMTRMMEQVVEMVKERNRRHEDSQADGSHVGKIDFIKGKARTLIMSNLASSQNAQRRVDGVELEDGRQVRAATTLLAMGAWTGSLVDLRGRAEARGQVLAYIPLTWSEADVLADMKVLLNCSNGMFAIPPVPSAATAKLTAPTSGAAGWTHELKIARHAYGYVSNSKVRVPRTAASKAAQTHFRDLGHDDSDMMSIDASLPSARFQPIPLEGQRDCRRMVEDLLALPANSSDGSRASPRDDRQHLLYQISKRAFAQTRLCWYSSTPTADFIIDYHPDFSDQSLLLATGGSGHAFKFLPLIGDCVVRRLALGPQTKLAQQKDRLAGPSLGEDEAEMMHMWRWREEPMLGDWGDEDGSRAGEKGAQLEIEWAREQENLSHGVDKLTVQ